MEKAMVRMREIIEGSGSLERNRSDSEEYA